MSESVNEKQLIAKFMAVSGFKKNLIFGFVYEIMDLMAR
jgi:hypothetical protein